jgi:hypothetical protein
MTRGDPSARRAAPQPLWSSAGSPSKSYPLASVAVATRPYGRPVKSWRAWSRWSRRTVQYAAAASRNGSRLSWAKRSWGIFAGGNREMKRESRCLRKPWLSCATQSQPTSDPMIRVAPDPECCFPMKGGVCAEVPTALAPDDFRARRPRLDSRSLPSANAGACASSSVMVIVAGWTLHCGSDRDRAEQEVDRTQRC